MKKQVTIGEKVITYRPNVYVQRALGACGHAQLISREAQEIFEILDLSTTPAIDP